MILTKNISYTIHPFPCHITEYITHHGQVHIINTTMVVERQRFSAVIVSLKSGFLKFISENLKNLIFELFEVLIVFFVKTL